MSSTFAAADLGASSGRVIAGTLHAGRFLLEEVGRFPNGPTEVDGQLRWDAPGLRSSIVAGVEEALRRYPGLAGVGVDTWGVDYGRISADGRLLELPFHYRDERTANVPAQFFADRPREVLYSSAGLQVMPFNTIFQLVADAEGGVDWDQVAQILLMPDLFSWWLSGRKVAEVTIASTTGLLDVSLRQWCTGTCDHLSLRYGIDVPRILPELVEPGTVIGPSAPGVLGREVPVIAVGGHDTASAVVSVPATTTKFAFISSGTWSLVGLELDAPVLSTASAAANFTNELGADGTVRYLKNVMGLWVLSESIRAWRAAGLEVDLIDLLARAAALPGLACVVDIDDERLLPPGDMPGRLQAMAAETGQSLSADPVTVTRCILDSLAIAYRRSVRTACAFADREIEVVHIVGGGSQNSLLCQLTADAIGLPVIAGPTEGTALGNLLLQARAVGVLSGTLTDLRAVARASAELTTHLPGGTGITADQWDAAERRLPD